MHVIGGRVGLCSAYRVLKNDRKRIIIIIMMHSEPDLLLPNLFPGIIKPPNYDLTLRNSTQLLRLPFQILIEKFQSSSPLNM